MTDPEMILSEFEQTKKLTGIFEIRHVTAFECHRNLPSGGVQDLEVKILDGGSSRGHLRYAISVRSSDGKTATGNPERTVREVLIGVHWWDLDR